MIPLYSTTIRRREMDAVLTCMVEERIGPGEASKRLCLAAKDFFKCEGAVALRSPAIALRYALCALSLERDEAVMVSALAPAWQISALEQMGYKGIILDVDEETALVTAQSVAEGMKKGGKVLLLHETAGLIPDMDIISSLGVQIIEDISQSAGGKQFQKIEGQDEGEACMAGMTGLYSIMGLEEHDGITAGGGAVLIAPKRREWAVLKHLAEEADDTDILPDLNSALAVTELKGFCKNEERRREIYALYQRACIAGANRTLPRDIEGGDVAQSFPVVLARSYKDAKQYADKKEVEIGYAFEGTVIAKLIARFSSSQTADNKRSEELSSSCKNAKSLLLRTVLFPLYSRLTSAQTEKIVKVVSTLP